MTEQQESESPRRERHPISRRLFLKGSSATMAATGIAAASFAAGQGVAAHQAESVAAQATPGAMLAMPAGTTASEPVAFFTVEQAQLVEALTARILPGTAADPGAREAGVTAYIDRVLAGPNLGYTLKTYNQGPFLAVETSPTPVEASSSRDIYQYVEVAKEDVARYGFQSVITPQDFYRRGLAAVAAYATSKFGTSFVSLTEAQQDQVVTALAAGTATGFDIPSAKAFFAQLRNDTIEGMFSDPMYGGNQGMVGWKLIGYPAAQLFYTAQNMKNPAFARAPQSLDQLIAKMGQ